LPPEKADTEVDGSYNAGFGAMRGDGNGVRMLR
jgi:hypothetical protein